MPPVPRSAPAQMPDSCQLGLQVAPGRAQVVARQGAFRVFLAKIRLDVAVQDVLFDHRLVRAKQLDPYAVILDVVLADSMVARASLRAAGLRLLTRADSVVLVRGDADSLSAPTYRIALDLPVVTRKAAGKQPGEPFVMPGP